VFDRIDTKPNHSFFRLSRSCTCSHKPHAPCPRMLTHSIHTWCIREHRILRLRMDVVHCLFSQVDFDWNVHLWFRVPTGSTFLCVCVCVCHFCFGIFHCYACGAASIATTQYSTFFFFSSASDPVLVMHMRTCAFRITSLEC
jgi:hypothetical protein